MRINLEYGYMTISEDVVEIDTEKYLTWCRAVKFIPEYTEEFALQSVGIVLAYLEQLPSQEIADLIGWGPYEVVPYDATIL